MEERAALVEAPDLPDLGHAWMRQVLEESRHGARSGTRPPTVFVSPRHVWDVLDRMYAQTRHESLSFDDPSQVVRHDIPERVRARSGQNLGGLLKRGGKVRQITCTAGMAANEHVGCIQSNSGGEAWILPEVPFKLLVLDRRVAVVPDDMRIPSEGILLIRDPVVVRTLASAHQAMRKVATELPGRAEKTRPPAHLKPVLAMLMAGKTDEKAAAQLGMSPRTYCRRVGELLAELGVATRFQAGAAVAERGWL